MMTKITFAVLVGLSMAVSTTSMTAHAQDLQLKKSGHMLKKSTVHPRIGHARLSAKPKHSKGEVKASNDYAADCKYYYGGGASTDPEYGETCTTPDGEHEIVPFP